MLLQTQFDALVLNTVLSVGQHSRCFPRNPKTRIVSRGTDVAARYRTPISPISDLFTSTVSIEKECTAVQ